MNGKSGRRETILLCPKGNKFIIKLLKIIGC
jgi:hypothetical protein